MVVRHLAQEVPCATPSVPLSPSSAPGGLCQDRRSARAAVLLVVDNSFAATASGSISLSEVTPLAGNMVIEVRTQSGDSGRFAGYFVAPNERAVC